MPRIGSTALRTQTVPSEPSGPQQPAIWPTAGLTAVVTLANPCLPLHTIGRRHPEFDVPSRARPPRRESSSPVRPLYQGPGPGATNRRPGSDATTRATPLRSDKAPDSPVNTSGRQDRAKPTRGTASENPCFACSTGQPGPGRLSHVSDQTSALGDRCEVPRENLAVRGANAGPPNQRARFNARCQREAARFGVFQVAR